MREHKKLRKFKKEELIFDAEETVLILRFLFKKKRGIINQMNVNDRIRGFAQGLLLEAVDASSSVGVVDALFRSTTNPTAGVKKILIKFGAKSFRHWFKKATSKDIMHIQIYERVQEQIEANFSRILIMHFNGTVLE